MSHKHFIRFRPDADPGGSGGNGGGNGEPDPGGQGAGGQVPDAKEVQETLAARERELQEVRQEAAKRRTENAALTKRIEELEGAGKTDSEKKEQAIKELEGKTGTLEATNRALRVRVLAGQAGISDPKAAEDAASLLDWSKVEDPDSETSVVKALKDLVKDRPYLGGNIAGGGDGGEGGGSRESGTQDMNRLIREGAGRG